MQIVMWAVLGCSVAIAAILDYHLRHGQIVDFSPATADESLTFRLPAGWKTWTRQMEGGATAHVAADSAGGVDRTLIISRQRVPHAMAPGEYILRALSVSGSLNVEDFKGIAIDGWPGESITWAAHRVSLGTGEEIQFTNCSAIVLPTDEAVMIRMDKNAPFDAADERLYRKILENIHSSAPPATDGGTIQLDGDVTVTAPGDLRLYPQVDPLLRERMMAQITDGGGWISAEFVPVTLPESEPSASLLAGLDARDPVLSEAWLTAEVSPQGPNHWVITPQQRATDPASPRRVAHVLTGQGSRGLIVVLSAEPPASSRDLDHLWEELSANIHVGQSSALSGALDAGAAIAKTAASSAPADTWWVWLRGATAVGFTHGLSDRDSKYVYRYTARRNWNGTATGVVQQWGADADSSAWARMMRSDAEVNLSDPLVPIFDQATRVADNITTIINGRNGRVTPTQTPLSPAFLLSRYLPAALSRVDRDLAAFWTDRFPGVEGELFPSPLLLLAHRVPDEQAMRCVVAEVNGTGGQSRWYFRGNGSVDHADFAGDLHLRTSTQSEVESAFAGDRRLTAPPR